MKFKVGRYAKDKFTREGLEMHQNRTHVRNVHERMETFTATRLRPLYATIAFP